MVAERLADALKDASLVNRITATIPRRKPRWGWAYSGRRGKIWRHPEGDYTALNAAGDYLPGTYATLADAVRALMECTP